MRLMMNIKKRYILSYAFVVLAVIALTNSILIFASTSALQDALQEEQMKRGQLLADEMDAQMDTYHQICYEIKNHYIFQPIYQRKFYTRRLELIDALKQYESYLAFDANMYLLYRKDDLIYFDNTCADWKTFCRLYWKIDPDSGIYETLYHSYDTSISTTGVPDGSIVISLPFFMGYGGVREECCLFFKADADALHRRISGVSGLKTEEYTVSFENQLLFGQGTHTENILQSKKYQFSIEIGNVSGENDLRLSAIQRTLLLLCIGLTVVSLAMAVFIAIRQYKPIGTIYQQLGGDKKGKNELMHIEQVISDTLRENDRVKQDISLQMDSLKSQSKIIEQQAVKLRGQLVLLLLLGVYRTREDLPDELAGLFCHPKFAALSLWGASEERIPDIEAQSTDSCRLFAVKLNRQERIAILANIENGEELSALVRNLGAHFGNGVVISAGGVTDISGVSASFMQSSGISAVQEADQTGEILLSPECKELFRAVREGNRDLAIERAARVSDLIGKDQLPLIEMKRLYLTLLKKLQNLAGELECSISEQNATALMLSLSPEDFSANLAKCISDLCEGEVLDDRPLEALELIAYIDEHACDSDMSLPLLEDAFDMNRKKIAAIVKSMTDMGFREYVVFQRIERAKLLLLNTKLSINAIAEMCGYESASYFIKSFKSITDKTPGQFQKDGM